MMFALKLIGLWFLASVPASLFIGAIISQQGKGPASFSNAFRVADEHAQQVADLVALGHADCLRALPITRLRQAGLITPTA